MKSLKLFFAAFIAMFVCGCNSVNGTGVTKTQEYNISKEFKRIEVSSAIEVEFTDKVDEISATGDEVAIENLEIRVFNNTLLIRMKGNSNVRTRITTKVYVPYFKDIEGIQVAGASDFSCDNEIISDNLSVKLSGASEVDIIIGSCNKLSLDISGASDADINGNVKSGRINISGASKLDADTEKGKYQLTFGNVRGDISGASSAKFHCDGDISVSLSGASHLNYSGDANTSGSSTSGASSIRLR